jgi:hypothetical protein
MRLKTMSIIEDSKVHSKATYGDFRNVRSGQVQKMQVFTPGAKKLGFACFLPYFFEDGLNVRSLDKRERRDGTGLSGLRRGQIHRESNSGLKFDLYPTGTSISLGTRTRAPRP